MDSTDHFTDEDRAVAHKASLQGARRKTRAVRRCIGGWLRKWGWLVYLGLVIASQARTWSQYAKDEHKADADRLHVAIPASSMNPATSADATCTIGYLRWTPDSFGADLSTSPSRASKPPVVLLHGSPGDASNFRRFAPLLARAGYDVYAIDLPGFGASDKFAPSFSNRAHAQAVLATMDALHITRAHLLGFSMGGGVALHMADIAPGRVATLTMLSSIGAQEGEGSGSYGFEHVKYALGFGALVALPEVIPQFGVLGSLPFRYTFIRNFWDTDQRPLKAIMRRLKTPTLILHGRRDPLVPSWVAELHHQLIGPSRLVILDESHFMVFRDPQAVADHMLPLLERHNTKDVPALRFIADFAPTTQDGKTDVGPFHIRKGAPWQVIVLLIVLATFISEDATVITVGLLITRGSLDWGVGLIGCYIGIVLGDGGLWAIGRFIGRPALRWPFFRHILPESALQRWGRWFDQNSVAAVFLARAIPGTRLPTYLAAGMLSRRTHHFLFWAVIAATIWTPTLLVLSLVVGAPLLTRLESAFGGPFAVVAALFLLFLLVRVLSYSTTWVGRRKMIVDLVRLVQPEFWPPYLFYLPLAPWLLLLSARKKPMTFTCVNPGIAHGGGVVGESKAVILEGLSKADAWIVPTSLIKAGPAHKERSDNAIDRIETDDRFGGYPVVLKPDASQRGHGLRIARSKEDVRSYFEEMTRDALLQRFHPGPCEAGVLWARRTNTGDIATAPGFVFSITRKVFAEVVGDGESTVERLIWKHRRHRMQAKVFLKRLANKTDIVLPKGERLRLGQAGNHSQGTMFVDGSDLITAALSQRFETIAQSFTHAGARSASQRTPRDCDSGFDFGRFDIRYESDEQLRKGESFVIIELNGTMSESTNLYDPKQSIWWMYSVLFRQWSHLYCIGAERRRSGVTPMGIRELLRTTRAHYHGRPGSKIAD